MKTSIIIIIDFISLISGNNTFLRNLEFAFSAATFGDKINNKCQSASPLEKTFQMTYTKESADTCTLTGTLRVKDAQGGTNDLNYSGTIGTQSPAECKIESSNANLLDGAAYGVDTVSCGSGSPTLTKSTNYYYYNSKHVDLGTSTATQTIDYDNNDTKSFTIKYKTTEQEDKPFSEIILKSGSDSKTLTTECTFASSVVTCTPTSTKLPGSKDGIEYTVTVKNLCGLEENPNIKVTVKSSSSNYFNISKLFLIIGLFLL